MREEVKTRMAAVFNEWAARYAANPKAFKEILDENGKPVEDYGEQCALCFEQIARDLFDTKVAE